MKQELFAGRYRLDGLVGSGGMANVYKAYDEQADMVVAIKMLKEEHKDDAEFLRRFEREANAVISLSHPNIVQSYDAGTDENGISYIVLEYVEGMTLKEYIKVRGALSPRETVNIANQVLDGLKHAHENGIIHRDVKPQNVMISGKTVKLTDFGIARDASSTTRTFAGTNVIGSVHYISPEQARGDDVTAESDIYSCAVMVYEMLTGTVPFGGDNTVAIALKHLQEEMIPPIEINSKIPQSMSDVVMKGAAKDPAVRYHSAEDMKNDLIRSLKEPRGRFARLTIKRKPAERKAGSRGVIIAAAVIIGVALIFTGVAFFGNILEGRGKGEEFLVPSLEGKTLEEARSLAELRGFVLAVSDYVISTEFPAGQVTKQNPINGARGKKGDTITVEVSSGSGYAIVPDMTGKTITEASLMLSEENLSIGSVGYDSSSELPAGQIVRQVPEAESRVPEFEAVDIWVSGTETPQLEMPSVVGRDTSTALQMLQESKIKRVWLHVIEPEEGMTDETVQQQSPAANMGISEDAVAEIWVSRSNRGSSYADIAVNLDIEAAESTVVITAVHDSGVELVLYEGIVKAGTQQPVAFVANIRSVGPRECVVYVDGAEVKRMEINFVLR